MRVVICEKCKHIWACSTDGKVKICRLCKEECAYKKSKAEVPIALAVGTIDFTCPNCAG